LEEVSSYTNNLHDLPPSLRAIAFLYVLQPSLMTLVIHCTLPCVFSFALISTNALYGGDSEMNVMH
jgi:hypothetical protein